MAPRCPDKSRTDRVVYWTYFVTKPINQC